MKQSQVTAFHHAKAAKYISPTSFYLIINRNMVKKLREALQQHTDGLDSESRIIENPTDPYGTGTDLSSFEDFLKMIKRCDSLLDVKRIRNTIVTQIRKKNALISRWCMNDICSLHEARTVRVNVLTNGVSLN